jgi:hypothetical protein
VQELISILFLGFFRKEFRNRIWEKDFRKGDNKKELCKKIIHFVLLDFLEKNLGKEFWEKGFRKEFKKRYLDINGGKRGASPPWINK